MIKNEVFEFSTILFRYDPEAGQQQCRGSFLVEKAVTQNFPRQVQNPGRGQGESAEVDIESLACILEWEQVLGGFAKRFFAGQEQGYDVPSKHVTWLITELVAEVRQEFKIERIVSLGKEAIQKHKQALSFCVEIPPTEYQVNCAGCVGIVPGRVLKGGKRLVDHRFRVVKPMVMKAVCESVPGFEILSFARLPEKRFYRMRNVAIASAQNIQCGFNYNGGVVVGNWRIDNPVEKVESAREQRLVLDGCKLPQSPEGVQSNGRG